MTDVTKNGASADPAFEAASGESNGEPAATAQTQSTPTSESLEGTEPAQAESAGQASG